MTAPARLAATDLTIGYDRRVISEGLSVAIPDGSFTVIVGANASGKSTLLRALARLLTPMPGRCASTSGRSATTRPRSWRARWASSPDVARSDASPWSTWSRGGDTRTRAFSDSGPLRTKRR